MRHTRNVTLALLALGALAFAWLALGPSPRAGTPAAGSGDSPPVKVAFIGDQGLGPNSVAVLQLIQNEGSDLVIHSGDFDYANDPGAWDAQITGVLGASFPYLASIGNHDDCCIAAYAAKVQARVDANSEITCVIATGETVISGSTCTFRGLYIVFTGPDVTGAGDTVYAPYIAGQLAATNAAWRICSWHKNQRLMQVGGKEDQAGWGVYEECRIGGGIVATAHEHSYSRTHLMSSFQNQTVASTSNTLTVEEGKSFVFVSGLGGASIRDQELDGPWWASIYTATQGANYGALFCTFFDTAEDHASCYFKDIDGVVPDQFELVSAVNGPGSPTPTPTPTPGPTPTPTPTATPNPSDSDGDGFPDALEVYLGTNPLAACGASAWPPDASPVPVGNGRVDGFDVFLWAQRFGSTTSSTPSGKLPYNARYDLNADSAINGSDIFILAQYFNETCA